MLYKSHYFNSIFFVLLCSSQIFTDKSNSKVSIIITHKLQYTKYLQLSLGSLNYSIPVYSQWDR